MPLEPVLILVREEEAPEIADRRSARPAVSFVCEGERLISADEEYNRLSETSGGQLATVRTGVLLKNERPPSTHKSTIT